MQHGVFTGVLQRSSLTALPGALGTGPLTLLAKWTLLLWGIVGLDIVYLDLLGIASRRHSSKCLVDWDMDATWAKREAALVGQKRCVANLQHSQVGLSNCFY